MRKVARDLKRKFSSADSGVGSGDGGVGEGRSKKVKTDKEGKKDAAKAEKRAKRGEDDNTVATPLSLGCSMG